MRNVLVASVFLVGCQSVFGWSLSTERDEAGGDADAVSEVATDTGSVTDTWSATDSGAVTDTWSATDSGAVTDTWSATDSGAVTDTWSATDSGAVADSSAVTDSATVTDSTTSTDATTASDTATTTDSGPSLPSCQGLSTLCGGYGDAGPADSCCTQIVVSGGSFCQGGEANDGGTCANDGSQYQTTVAAYKMDKYLVTVGRYRQFANAYNSLNWRPTATMGQNPTVQNVGFETGSPVAATGWQVGFTLPSTTPSGSGSGCSYSSGAGTNDTLPINCIDWYEAFAFCIWDGGYLPTESEYEYAASNGGTTTYPWGNTPAPDCNHANFYNSTTYCYPGGAVSPVGYFAPGASNLGFRDLAGNTWEWSLDLSSNYPSVATTNYAEESGSGNRVIRGGSWNVNAFDLAASSRGNLSPTDNTHAGVGFRCSRAL